MRGDHPIESSGTKYRLRVRQFCALSKAPKFQSWLQSVSQKLYDELMEHLRTSVSCRSNTSKMVEIEKKLEELKLMSSLVQFLKREYPQMVEEITDKATPVKTQLSRMLEANPRKMVFKYYYPNLLTFPQKAIMQNEDVVQLEKDVKEFCLNKAEADYLIVENLAYIEYFKLKYAREAKQIPKHEREIYRFKLQNGMEEHECILKSQKYA